MIRSLIPGEEFMIEPYSNSLKGIYSIEEVDLTNWKSYLNKKISTSNYFWL